ncbi:30S ribosomal protein S21 [Lutibacter sp. B1]|uniref:30S ribosomal protein S21 n=1 Tax=Lutibacter sp. B1 TaxID=2725996 RepID=UPI001457301F|nr:30S ribosomal protein S21 [Lutibacter sp. B1]NLP59176.1 30S ribosomal protein S21 [Lutibacter sp. B1]
MLIIKVQDNEKIDRALKRYRNKTRKTKLINNLRENKHYTKKSIKRRKQVEKAKYKQYLSDKENI